MEKIWYFGKNSVPSNVIKEWLEGKYQLIDSTDPISQLLHSQIADKKELILIDLEELSANDQDTLFKIIKQNKIGMMSPVILMINQTTNINDLNIPDAVLESETVDLMQKPLCKQIVHKRIQLILRFQKCEASSLQSEEKLINCQKDAEQKALTIDQSIKENHALLQEIHHRVKNNLQIVSSILSFKTQEIVDPKVQDILKITISRVDAISLIHKKLYESSSLAMIDMLDYIKQQVSDLFYSYPGRSNCIDLNFEIVPFTLEVTPAIHFALLMNELIVNVILHAFPDDKKGHLKISVKPYLQEQLKLIIKDNGVGIKGDPETLSKKSIGMRLIYQLVLQLKGTIQHSGSPGTCFEIIFSKSL